MKGNPKPDDLSAVSINTLAVELHVSAGILARAIENSEIYTYNDPIYGYCISLRDAYKIIDEIIDYQEQTYTVDDAARILHREGSTIRRWVREGYIKPVTCRWLSTRKLRFTQEEMSSLVYKLDTAEPDWRTRKRGRIDLGGTGVSPLKM